MMKKCKARISKISKDDMRICSSRVIWAELTDEANKVFHVAWADTPSVIGVTGNWSSRNKDSFEMAWNRCKIGDEVWLYHVEDSSFNYFEPQKELR